MSALLLCEGGLSLSKLMLRLNGIKVVDPLREMIRQQGASLQRSWLLQEWVDRKPGAPFPSRSVSLHGLHFPPLFCIWGGPQDGNPCHAVPLQTSVNFPSWNMLLQQHKTKTDTFGYKSSPRIYQVFSPVMLWSKTWKSPIWKDIINKDRASTSQSLWEGKRLTSTSLTSISKHRWLNHIDQLLSNLHQYFSNSSVQHLKTLTPFV